MSKSNKERQAELKARREAEGKVKRPYWATPGEHDVIKAVLKGVRSDLNALSYGVLENNWRRVMEFEIGDIFETHSGELWRVSGVIHDDELVYSYDADDPADELEFSFKEVGNIYRAV